ncbi:lipopolysaccharide biosynthesis protein [Stieleria sp. TO1_6]|uniref:lipopolysaccharide biosynthesis protein n=1 Tax=Stieleria tagensis TaxID=2956795 RepID=UPI00209A9326|nr:lipopolysaccharide biosynthesis protein [Stieleria tagensis]MCO8120951.1 lipopolysaccharide biosynthesis protein [Stieleria tagensis]
MPRKPSNTETNPQSFVADSLATGMLVMLAMTVVQRAFGFFRGILFCRLMDDASVGQWAMAFGFITMITPIMLMGMPGSLPRFVEHYRSRGHLNAFVRRLAIGTIVCALVFLAALFGAPDWFGWLIFLQPQNRALVHAVGIGVLSIIVYYFVNELVSALRQVRIVSSMQFIQSVGFTLLGVTWLSIGGGLTGLVLVFAVATLLAIIPGMITLARGWRGLPVSGSPLNTSKMWRRILPYAGALWVMNLLANLFELSDRYMILHLTAGGESIGQAAVGQYHSGRIIPVLLMSLATMISGVLLPYLAADWEAGQKQAVRTRLRETLFAISALFTLGAAVALWIAPTLFTTLLQDRYQAGLTLMPMAFTFCIWAALATIAQNYLWVTEQGKWAGLALAIGLAANLALNAFLLPRWGLHGAVVATLCSHGIVLLGIWVALWACGFRLDQSTCFITLWPACLVAGPWVAIVSVIAVLVVSQDARQIIARWSHDPRLRRLCGSGSC